MASLLNVDKSKFESSFSTKHITDNIETNSKDYLIKCIKFEIKIANRTRDITGFNSSSK